MLFEYTSDEIKKLKKEKKDLWNLVRLDENNFRLEHITVSENDDQRFCIIPSKYLVPAIRSSESANSFISQPNCYVLSLPPELPSELSKFRRNYITWAEKKIDEQWSRNRSEGHKRVSIVKKASMKINKQGQKVYDQTPWFHHARKNGCDTILGTNFMMCKYNLMTRKTFSIFSIKPTAVNHSIHVIKSDRDKLIASWMASSLYALSLFMNQQVISKSYATIQIKDFDNVKFPKLAEFNEDERTELISKWETLAAVPNDDVPRFPQQIGMDKITKGKKVNGEIQPDTIEKYEPMKERVDLDNAWLKILGVSEKDIDKTRNEVYKWLIDYIETY